MLVSFLFFLAACLFTFYLPGRWILRKIGFRTDSKAILITHSLTLGISIFLLSMYLLAWIHASYLYILFMFFILFVEGLASRKELSSMPMKDIWTLETVFIALGTVAMSYLTVLSGLIRPNGSMVFFGINGSDSIYHLSLIGSLLQFPPMHLALFPLPIRGYNFFYDFLTVGFHQLYYFNILDLFFRFFPFLMSLLLGLSIYCLGKVFRLSKIAICLLLYLVYFARTFDFFFATIFSHFGILFNSAGIVVSVEHILDASVVLAIILFCNIFIAFFSDKKRVYMLPAVIMIGILPMVKIHAGVIMYGALGLLSITAILWKRNFVFLYTLLLSAIVAAVTYLPLNAGAGQLVFSPFRIYTTYIEDGDIFQKWNWNILIRLYWEKYNVFRLAEFYIVAGGIFFLSSLGVRIIGVIYSLFSLKKKISYTYQYIFWGSTILVAFLIPSFFVQSVASYVIIQFLWIGYMLLLLPTAIGLEKIFHITTWKRFLILIVILTVLNIPELYNTYKNYTSAPEIVSKDLITVLEKARTLDKHAAMIVINPTEINAEPIVTALTQQPVYYEAEGMGFVNTEQIVSQRNNLQGQISGTVAQCASETGVQTGLLEFMAQNHAKYVLNHFEDTDCLQGLGRLQLLIQSGQYSLYQVK